MLAGSPVLGAMPRPAPPRRMADWRRLAAGLGRNLVPAAAGDGGRVWIRSIGAVLAAIAGGAGGALGGQVWVGVSALVRRCSAPAPARGLEE